jgi:hypothetical protein
MSNYGNHNLMQNQYKVQHESEVQMKQSTEQRCLSPIEERAQQLEKELVMLAEAVSCLAGRIDKVMAPVTEQDGKLGGIGNPQPPQSAMTRALDYAIRSIEVQRIELMKMSERVEL